LSPGWVARVAKARGVKPDQLEQLVASSTEARDLQFLGEARVNIMKLNLKLDTQFTKP
jgi:K+-transporting ATPase ATPase C chain